MSVLLSDSTIIEKCAVTKFLWSKGGKTLGDSQKNVSTIWRKVYYAKESAPTDGKVLKWQNKGH
jgi:hypothetical protein